MTTHPTPPAAVPLVDDTHETVVARLGALAADRPDAVALEAGASVLTYREVHEWAARAATQVTEADPGPGPVGVWAPAGTAEPVVGLLGVLAAGRAALVVEPAAPDPLLRRWLTAGPVGLIVATGGDRAERAELSRRTRRAVMDTTAPSPRGSGTPRTAGPSAADAAVVAPTTSPDHPLRWSTHATLAAQARADAAVAGLTPGDRVAVPVPLASAPGRRGVLAALWAGATVVLREPARWPSAELRAWLAAERASVLASTPSSVALVDAAGGDALPGLHTVLLLDAAAADARPSLRAAPTAAVVPAPEVVTPLPDRATTSGDSDGGGEGPDLGDVEGSGDATPDHPLAVALTAIWEELLGVSPVPRDEDFFALGGYSLLAARMLVLLEERTGVRLPMAVFLEATTVEALAAAADAQAAASSHPLVVAIREGDAALPPLFLTHDLQGSAWRFRPLAEAAGGNQATYGFESPFLEGRADFLTIGSLAAHYVEGVRAVQPEGPYHLAGYSFGGILAFEIARLLRAGGDEVALLGIVDVGPGYRGLDYSRRREPPLPYLRDAVEGPTGRLPRWARPARRLWLNRWVLPRRWRRRARQGGSVPADQRLWFAWWSHWHLVGPDWAPSPYDGRIDLFWAETTEGTDATMGWGRTGAEVVVHPVPGRHESLMDPPAVDHIGVGLRTRLGAGSAPR
ncbi:MAG: hypothetical protein JNK12_01665 [Acidimicrobiales bacterium]|nr:hypothetical protein [Acidimicrobiales bacterium]